MKHSTKQNSDTILIALLIFFISGFQNAYTYMARGGVFANLQTGNMILASVNIAFGNYDKVAHYLIPLIFFAFSCYIGTIIQIKTKFNEDQTWHWRSNFLMIQCLIFFTVGWMPQSLNLIANSLIACNAAFILLTFSKFKGISMPSTMMIGNLKNSMACLAKFTLDHNIQHIHHFCFVFGLLTTFIIGCIASTFCVNYLSTQAIWLAIPLTLFMLFLIQIQPKERQ